MASTSVFEFVDRRLTKVSYLKLSPPIEIPEGRCPRISCRLRPEPFRIPLPVDSIAIAQDLAQDHDGLRPGTAHFEERLKEYGTRVKEGRFGEAEEYPKSSKGNASNYRVFSRLVNHSTAFQAARQKVFRDYLTKSRFDYNGMFFAAHTFREMRTREKAPALEIELYKSDCYTYRSIGALAQLLGNDFWKGVDKPPRVGPYLTDYVGDASSFQRNIHNGFGLDLIVHTMQDNRFIITRRSPNVENSSGSAGKYFESVCEGLDDDDLDDVDSTTLSPFSQLVRRALKEELIHADKPGAERGTELLDERICRRCITGAMLYLSNMSINLCGLVSFDCCADDIRRVYPQARDSHYESRIIDERQWDVSSGLPQFSSQDIERFIKETVGDHALSDVWDEGSLVTLCLSTLALHEEPAARDAMPRDCKTPSDYLDLDQIAFLMRLKRRSMENYKRRKKDPLPDPDVAGGGGKRDYWLWSTIRPWLVRNSRFPVWDSFPDVRPDR